VLLRPSPHLKIAIPPIFFWESARADLKVESRSAFYPGHVTSRLCLTLLEKTLRSCPCRNLLDVGCGSGILALTAARIGVPFTVGLDIDFRAVVLSRVNGTKNGLSDRCHWYAGTVHALQGRFDCIAANLPYFVLMESVNDLERLLAAEGLMILSGFHDIQFYEVKEELLLRGLEIQETTSGDLSFCGVPPSGSFTWMAVSATRTSSHRSKGHNER